MSNSLQVDRQAKKRAAWALIQARGKAAFLLRTTLNVAVVIIVLTYLPLHRYLLHQQSRLVPLAYCYLSFLVLGYVVGVVAWRRGLRITGGAD